MPFKSIKRSSFFPLQTAFVVDEVSNIVKEVRGEMPTFKIFESWLIRVKIMCFKYCLEIISTEPVLAFQRTVFSSENS